MEGPTSALQRRGKNAMLACDSRVTHLDLTTAMGYVLAAVFVVAG